MSEILRPEGWGAPKGYSDGIVARGRTVFVSGQIGWDPETQQIASADFATQVRQALANVLEVVASAGGTAEHVTRLTWFVTNRDAYVAARTQMGTDYRAMFGRHYPAMSVVFVQQLLEPQALVEIEATAVIPD